MTNKQVQVRHCFVAKKRHTVNAMIYIDIFAAQTHSKRVVCRLPDGDSPVAVHSRI
ncbi:MAG: hypothetical protein HT580_07500 [Dechloromonas sp.]|nr:MAG: hypothetical protein HT580_07500 [Dechloromonas sp.]